MGPVVLYALTHAALEIPYIMTYGQDYLHMMRSIAKDPGAPANQHLYALIAYAIFCTATYVFVFRDTMISKDSLAYSLGRAALFGAAVYGIFDLTNLFAFKEYNVGLAMTDLAYGILVMVIIASVAFSSRNVAGM